jgi:hypothetical protein
MRCRICTRPDAKAINLELLQRVGRRSGTVTAMAERLGVHRATLWRHRKEHLKIYTSRKPVKTEGLSFEERARLLSAEADRLLCQLENGMPRDIADQGLKALALRVKLLEMESRFAGRPMTAQREDASALEDPDEEARAQREFEEVVGAEK